MTRNAIVDALGVLKAGRIVDLTHLVHPGIQCGLSHHRHGIMSIGRKLRMGMVICQIHTLPHFLNFLKNFFRSS